MLEGFVVMIIIVVTTVTIWRQAYASACPQGASKHRLDNEDFSYVHADQMLLLKGLEGKWQLSFSQSQIKSLI